MNKHTDNEYLGAIIIALFLLVISFIVIKSTDSSIKLDGTEINLNGTETETYLNGNDGYVPVHYVACTAMRSGDHVDVEYKGNLYSAYVTNDSEIQTGDRIICMFAYNEGEIELVDIK